MFLKMTLASRSPLADLLSVNGSVPPGSEAERELLKPHLLAALEALPNDARRMRVVWPDCPTRLLEEPLFVAKVAQECGPVDSFNGIL
ncbi:unnamed protein product [Protopolystoma xenopodis]|uniref:Uncharacterized protein n=1 Tax=Protopolystoma xenopodis TaxID=117903 RepID=A0A448XF45_9PLAT|nr:unnamed protein product [Protopolystoma xenopodis]